MNALGREKWIDCAKFSVSLFVLLSGISTWRSEAAGRKRTFGYQLKKVDL